MVTAAAFRKLVLSLPEAVESEHMGHPDFRVRKKIFATLWPGERFAVVKVDKDLAVGLIEAEPTKFAAGWGTTGWTKINLDHVKVAEIRELIVQSWRSVAPRRIVAAYDAGG